MGQYFHFINRTTGVVNEKGISKAGGLSWMAKFDSTCERNEIIAIFEEVIEMNGWNRDDEIVASGDSGDEVRWSDYLCRFCDKATFHTETDGIIKCTNEKCEMEGYEFFRCHQCSKVTFCDECSVCHLKFCSAWDLEGELGCHIFHLLWCEKCEAVRCETSFSKGEGCLCPVEYEVIDQDGCEPRIEFANMHRI